MNSKRYTEAPQHKHTVVSQKSAALLPSLALSFILVLSLILGACTSTPLAEDSSSDDASSSDAVAVKVGSLKGPTSIGLVNFMERVETDSADLQNNYDFSIVGTSDELVPQLISGELDIALVPSNLAATLYNRTEGEIIALNINTLGVLYVVSGDDSLTSLESLAGKTVFMTGKGTTPDYVMSYLLEESGLSSEVTLEFKSEATEVAAALAADPQAVAVLPEPYVSAVCLKDASIAPRISLTEVWTEVTEKNGESSQLVTGVTVVRASFAEEYPQVVAEFTQQQAQSVDESLAHPADTAELVVKQGILDNAAAAEQALPRCNLVYIDGEEMEQALSGYLQVLMNKDPSSLGGSMPGADFYYR